MLFYIMKYTFDVCKTWENVWLKVGALNLNLYISHWNHKKKSMSIYLDGYFIIQTKAVSDITVVVVVVIV